MKNLSISKALTYLLKDFLTENMFQSNALHKSVFECVIFMNMLYEHDKVVRNN